MLVQLLVAVKMEEVFFVMVLGAGMQEALGDSPTGLAMRSIFSVLFLRRERRKDVLRCNHCGMVSLDCEGAGYTSRHNCQNEREHETNCQTADGRAETADQVVLCLDR